MRACWLKIPGWQARPPARLALDCFLGFPLQGPATLAVPKTTQLLRPPAPKLQSCRVSLGSLRAEVSRCQCPLGSAPYGALCQSWSWRLAGPSARVCATSTLLEESRRAYTPECVPRHGTCAASRITRPTSTLHATVGCAERTLCAQSAAAASATVSYNEGRFYLANL